MATKIAVPEGYTGPVNLYCPAGKMWFATLDEAKATAETKYSGAYEIHPVP